jgi:esterase/lipase superfamily enzyme
LGFGYADSAPGWGIAEIIAKKNGPKLAHFIFDLKDNCPNTDIRLIAHSLGARLVLSALNSLHNENQEWNNKNFKVASVHLMGAAVDDEEPSKNYIDSINQPKAPSFVVNDGLNIF